MSGRKSPNHSAPIFFPRRGAIDPEWGAPSMALRLMGRVTLALVAAPLLLVFCLGPASTAAGAADPIYRLGGSDTIPPNSVVKIGQGQTIPPVQSMTIENLGSGPADMEVSAPTKTQIRIIAQPQTFTLEVGERRTVPFAIEVPATQAPGTFPIAVTAQQTNVERPAGGGLVTVPGVTVKFQVRVVGGLGRVTVNAVNKDDGSPVEGDLSLLLVSPGLPEFVVASQSGTSLAAKVAPGSYVARFQIPGLTEQREAFAVANGENKIVKLQVQAINFVLTGAKPSYDGDKVVAVDLIASLTNNLKILAGPVTFNAIVRRDGQEVETVQIQQQPSLPQGLTEVKTSYRPSAGFEPGTYTFEFNIKTPTYTVTATNIPEVVVKSPTPWLLIFGITGGIVVIVVAGAYFLRRRHRLAQ